MNYRTPYIETLMLSNTKHIQIRGEMCSGRLSSSCTNINTRRTTVKTTRTTSDMEIMLYTIKKTRHNQVFEISKIIYAELYYESTKCLLRGIHGSDLPEVEIPKSCCINIFNFQGTSCYCLLDSITAHNGIVDVSKTTLENSCLTHETSYMKVYNILKRKYKEIFYINILLHRVMSTL